MIRKHYYIPLSQLLSSFRFVDLLSIEFTLYYPLVVRSYHILTLQHLITNYCCVRCLAPVYEDGLRIDGHGKR